jgi:hypothetical protein
LRADDVLALPTRLTREYQIERDAVTAALAGRTVQNLGLAEFFRRMAPDIHKPPVFLVPGTKHYSFPKAAALLGIGASHMIDVPVDLDARLNAAELESLLVSYTDERRPVLAVVCVIGSTEESSIDPIAEVLQIRSRLQRKGLDFVIHADAAWGGYHASLVRDNFDMPEPGLAETAAPPLAVPLSHYVTEQFHALGQADSITVDPHKSGYIPYPAGALCYRNSAMRDLVTFAAPVVFHGEAEPTVGIYGVEGSKPGAAAAAVYLSHRVIRPTKDGYGKIIGQALYSCKKLYVRQLCMARADDPFVVVPLPRLPAERDGGDVASQLQFIRDRIDQKTPQQLLGDPEALQLLFELGPDENILSYAFNFKAADGRLNCDLESANRLNRALYARLSIDPGQDIYGYDLIVSTTDLDVSTYGEQFIKHFKSRMGVEDSAGMRIVVLRSVVMDPWATETASGSFIDVLEHEFRKAVTAALSDTIPRQTRGY